MSRADLNQRCEAWLETKSGSLPDADAPLPITLKSLSAFFESQMPSAVRDAFWREVLAAIKAKQMEVKSSHQAMAWAIKMLEDALLGVGEQAPFGESTRLEAPANPGLLQIYAIRRQAARHFLRELRSTLAGIETISP